MASLFHSLVVVGAGVSASACGGVTNVSSGGTLDNTAGHGGAGGEAGRGSGAALNTGAQSAIGLGGSVGRGGTGGTLIIADGGAAGTGPGSIPLPDPGTLAQWNCTGQLGGCAPPLDGMQVNPYYLLDSCPIDPSRPRSAADCASDRWFRCLPARTTDVAAVFAVNCDCAPMLDAGCNCDGVGPSFGHDAVCQGHDMMCGCAYTGIAH